MLLEVHLFDLSFDLDPAFRVKGCWHVDGGLVTSQFAESPREQVPRELE